MTVNTYKGLALKVYLWGLHPLDLAFVCVVSMLVLMVTYMGSLFLLSLVVGYLMLRRYRNVDLITRKIFLRFLVAPALLKIQNVDIPSYRSCLK